MLDEIKEVEAYLVAPQTDNPRIQPELFISKGLKLYGIADYLTMICRHYLYEYSSMKDKGFDEKVRANAKLIMRAWCGFSNDLIEEELNKVVADNEEWFKKYPDAKGWLSEYFKKQCPNSESEWNKCSKEWTEKLNSELVYTTVKNNYETILAQALAQGELKTYYIRMKEEFNNIVFSKKDGKGKAAAPTKKKIIKLISVYMLQSRFHKGQKWVVLPKRRFLNWLGEAKEERSRWLPGVSWEGNELFECASEHNSVKITVNQDFLETMDVKITETKPEHSEEYNVYGDGGYGKELVVLKNI